MKNWSLIFLKSQTLLEKLRRQIFLCLYLNPIGLPKMSQSVLFIKFCPTQAIAFGQCKIISSLYMKRQNSIKGSKSFWKVRKSKNNRCSVDSLKNFLHKLEVLFTSTALRIHQAFLLLLFQK